MAADDDFVTRGECDRSHEGLHREIETEGTHVAKALDRLGTEIGNIWTAIGDFREQYRNHIPPWTTMMITLESLLLGAFIAKVVWN